MKKTIIFAMALSILLLTGCTNKASSPTVDIQLSEGVQAAYDNSVEASAYADELLKEMLSQRGITEYEIELTAGGFLTSEPLTFLVGYRYTCDEGIKQYGYQLCQTKDGFSVIKEGEEIGAFIVGDNIED